MLKYKVLFCNYLYVNDIIFTFVASFLDQAISRVVLRRLNCRKGFE